MNCSEFENIVTDLASSPRGERMIEAGLREAGLDHSDICARCEARLADERALVAGLGSLAASEEGRAAPASLEAALLESFRAQAPNRVARRLSVQSRRWPRMAFAAAAVILIIFSFIVYRANLNEPQKANQMVKENPRASQPSVNRVAQVMKENGAPRPRHGSFAQQNRGAQRSRRGDRLQLKRPIIRDSTTSYASDNEYTTDYFPISYSDNQESVVSDEVIRLQVIRVQMPRPALIAFGLPVNIERADVPVMADLLVGEDGLARAIRFVR